MERKIETFNKSKVSAKEIVSPPADDIDDPKHYNIEVEKQKSEHDRMIQLADDKKQRIKVAPQNNIFLWSNNTSNHQI